VSSKDGAIYNRVRIYTNDVDHDHSDDQSKVFKKHVRATMNGLIIEGKKPAAIRKALKKDQNVDPRDIPSIAQINSYRHRNKYKLIGVSQINTVEQLIDAVKEAVTDIDK